MPFSSYPRQETTYFVVRGRRELSCFFFFSSTNQSYHLSNRKREGLREFETVMQTRDEVEGLHNRREFSQHLECLYQAMETQEKSLLLLL